MDLDAGLFEQVRDTQCQPVLPRPPRPRIEDDAVLLEGDLDGGELVGATDQAILCSRDPVVRPVGLARRQLVCPVGADELPLDHRDLVADFQADAGERSSCSPAGPERLGGSPGTLEGDHERRPQPLVQRSAGERRLEHRNEFVVAAAPQADVAVGVEHRKAEAVVDREIPVCIHRVDEVRVVVVASEFECGGQRCVGPRGRPHPPAGSRSARAGRCRRRVLRRGRSPGSRSAPCRFGLVRSRALTAGRRRTGPPSWPLTWVERRPR